MEMEKAKKLFLLCVVGLLLLQSSCATKTSHNSTTEQPTTTTTKTLETLNAEDIISAFKKAGTPLEKVTTYTAETDPNKLLGRPHQYTGKLSWNDQRVKEKFSQSLDCTIEVFDNKEDLDRRKNYVDEIGKASPMFLSYQFAHKNILLRLDKNLTPQQAAEYEKALKAL